MHESTRLDLLKYALDLQCERVRPTLLWIPDPRCSSLSIALQIPFPLHCCRYMAIVSIQTGLRLRPRSLGQECIPRCSRFLGWSDTQFLPTIATTMDLARSCFRWCTPCCGRSGQGGPTNWPGANKLGLDVAPSDVRLSTRRCWPSAYYPQPHRQLDCGKFGFCKVQRKHQCRADCPTSLGRFIERKRTCRPKAGFVAANYVDGNELSTNWIGCFWKAAGAANLGTVAQQPVQNR